MSLPRQRAGPRGAAARSCADWLRRFGRWALVLALAASLGLHWALLQTVAWTGMIIGFARTGSFADAVSKTFDGRHPCCLCKAIEQGRAGEKQPDQPEMKPGMKLEPALAWSPASWDFRCARERLCGADRHAPGWREPPPKPRPRDLRPLPV